MTLVARGCGAAVRRIGPCAAQARLRADRAQRERGGACCAAGSTASRSPSSSPRRACARLSPEDLVARLDQRFRLLTGAAGPRSSVIRPCAARSTGPTTCWSSTDAHALNRLSVFAGGCDLAAAEAVLAGDDLDADDVVDVLGQLVDKSLVLVDPDADGRDSLLVAGDDPPVRPGAPRSRRRRRGASTPARRLLRRRGRRSRAGPAQSRTARDFGRNGAARSTTSAPRSTGRSRPGRPTMGSGSSRLWPWPAWPSDTPPCLGPTSRARSPRPRITSSSRRCSPGRHGPRSCAVTTSEAGTSPARRKPPNDA